MTLALPSDLDAEGRMLVEMVDGIARDLVAPMAPDVDHRGEVPEDLVGTLAGQGLLGAGVAELSGADVDVRYGLLVTSRLARVSGSVAAIAAAVHDGAAAFGDRERLRGRAADWVPTLAPHGVVAVRSGSGFELRGRLPRVELEASRGGLVVLAAQQDADDIVVEIDPEREGIEIGPRERTTGLRGRTYAGLVLDGVRVEPSDVIGGPREAERTRVTRSLTTAALGLGVALGAFEAAAQYAEERRQFGAALATFPAVRGHLLEMEQQVATVAALLWGAARRDSADPGERLAALRATRAAVQAVQVVPRLAVQVLGGYGFIEEYPVEVRLRDGASITARAGGIEALSVAAAPGTRPTVEVAP